MTPCEVVYALHDFQAENDDEIDFNSGEPIIILEKDSQYMDGWWQGRNIHGDVGLFPISYTSQNKPSTTVQPKPSTSTSSSAALGDDFAPTPEHSTKLPARPANPKEWNTNHVANWLVSAGLGSIADIFIDQEITGDILLELTLDTLKELGITTFGKRYKVMNAITTLKASLHPSTTLRPITRPDPRRSLSRTRSQSERSRATSPAPSTADTIDLSGYLASKNELDYDYNSPPPQSPYRPESGRPASPLSLSSSGMSLPSDYQTWSSSKSGISVATSRSAGNPSRSMKHAEPNGFSTSDSDHTRQLSELRRFSTTDGTQQQELGMRRLYAAEHQPSVDWQDLEDGARLPELEGWLHKQGDRYKTWNKRWFVLKGSNLFYFKSPKDVRMKGIINLRGYRIVTDERIHPGKFCFRVQHDHERTFCFYTNTEEAMKMWVKALMKTTITRNLAEPVLASSQISTIPLDVARRMRPRPPSTIMYKQNSQSKGESRMEMVQEEGAADDQNQYSRYYIDDGPNQARLAPIVTPEDNKKARKKSIASTSTYSTASSSGSWRTVDYVNWINAHLPPGMHAANLGSAFRDGETLIVLLEQLLQKPISRPSSSISSSTSMKSLDNIVTAFKAMGQEGIHIEQRCTIKDVMTGDEDKVKVLVGILKEMQEQKMLTGLAGTEDTTCSEYPSHADQSHDSTFYLDQARNEHHIL